MSSPGLPGPPGGNCETTTVKPHVAIGTIPLESADGTYTIGRDAFPQFAEYERLGVYVQSDQVRVAHPDPEYVETALAALAEACGQLNVPEASIVFIDTVVPPPAVGLRYGFKGSYTTDYPSIIWIYANWTSLRSSGRPSGTRRPTLRSPAPTPPRSPRVTPDRRRTSRWRSSMVPLHPAGD